jgi:hypothetical protein
VLLQAQVEDLIFKRNKKSGPRGGAILTLF